MAKKVADITTPTGLTPLPSTPRISLERAGASGRALARTGAELASVFQQLQAEADTRALLDLQTGNITTLGNLRDAAMADPSTGLNTLNAGLQARIDEINSLRGVSDAARRRGLADLAQRSATVRTTVRTLALNDSRDKLAASGYAKIDALRKEALLPGITPEQVEEKRLEAAATLDAMAATESISFVAAEQAKQVLDQTFTFGSLEAQVRASIEVAKDAPTPDGAETAFVTAEALVGVQKDITSDQRDQLMGEIETGRRQERQQRTREREERQEAAGRGILSQYIKGITPVVEGEEQTPLLTPADIAATPGLSLGFRVTMLRLVSIPPVVTTDQRYFQLLRQSVRRGDFATVEEFLPFVDPLRLSEEAMGTAFNEFLQSRDRTQTAFLRVKAEHFDLAHALFTKTPVDMFGGLLDGVSPERSAVLSILMKGITAPSLENTLASYTFREAIEVELARLEAADENTSAFFRPSATGGFWDMLEDALSKVGKAPALEEAPTGEGGEPAERTEAPTVPEIITEDNVEAITPEQIRGINIDERTDEEARVLNKELKRRKAEE